MNSDSAPSHSVGNSAAIVLALIIFFPLGLYLMWRSSDWSLELTWGVSGLFLPPLWVYFIWRSKFGVALKLLLSAALVVLVDLFDVSGLGITGSAPWFILLLNILILFLIARASFTVDSEVRTRSRAIEGKLEACHDLIVDIEAHPLPVGSPLNATYMRALEMRVEGLHLFEGGQGKATLVEADARLSDALAELRLVLGGLTEEAD